MNFIPWGLVLLAAGISDMVCFFAWLFFLLPTIFKAVKTHGQSVLFVLILVQTSIHVQ